MHSSILSSFAVLAFAASASAVPYGYQPPSPPSPAPSNQSCSEKARSLTHWTAANVSFSSSILFTNPAHQVDSATFQFSLENPVLNYNADCHATSTQLADFFYGNLIYKCNNVDGNDWTSFSFNRPTNELQVNQSWACHEDGSHFTAQGRAKLNLECNEKKWQNPKWNSSNDGFYSTDFVSCKNLTTSVQIEQIVAVA